MEPLSREAAIEFARQEIKQKRIDRIKAVRNKEKLIAKKQLNQYSQFQHFTQQQIENEMEKQWILIKNDKLQQLKEHYDKIQSNIGSGHDSAKENINNLNKMALFNQKLLNKQNETRQQRANNAISKIQQKIINEQNQKLIRAKWRNNAIEMAQIHRKKLQKQLEYQYLTFC